MKNKAGAELDNIVLILKGLVMIWTSMDEELDKNFEIRNFNAPFLLCVIVREPEKELEKARED